MRNHERLLGRPGAPGQLGGNSPHGAGDRGVPATVVVGGGCEAARGAKSHGKVVLERRWR